MHHTRLQLIPATAKRANGVQYEARLNRQAQSHSDLIDVDLKVRTLPSWLCTHPNMCVLAQRNGSGISLCLSVQIATRYAGGDNIGMPEA